MDFILAADMEKQNLAVYLQCLEHETVAVVLITQMGLTEYVSLETAERFPMSGCITDIKFLYKFWLHFYNCTVDFETSVMCSEHFSL